MKRNIIWLYVAQITNLCVPLLTIPVLSHALGVAGLGRFGYVQAVALMASVFVDFGFDSVAARMVSNVRYDPEPRNQVVLVIFVCKLCLALGVYAAVLIWASLAATPDRSLFPLVGLAIFGQLLIPTWFFQGMDRLPVLALTTAIIRLLAFPLISVTVTSQADLPLALALMLGQPALIGVIACVLLADVFRVRFKKLPQSAEIANAFHEAFSVFSATVFTTVYTYLNVIFLRLFCGEVAVGYFVPAEKIANVAKQLLVPITQAHFVSAADAVLQRDPEKFYRISKRAALMVLAAGAVGLSFGIPLAMTAIRVIFAEKFLGSVIPLQILLVNAVVVGFALVQLQLGLVGAQFLRPLKWIYGAGAVGHLTWSPFLIRAYGATGAAASVLITESVMTALLMLASRSARRRLFNYSASIH